MSRRIIPVYLPERAEMFVSTELVKPKSIPYKDGKQTAPLVFGRKIPLLGCVSRGLDLDIEPSTLRVEKLYFQFPNTKVVAFPIGDHMFAWPFLTVPGRKAEWGVSTAQEIYIPDLYQGRLTVLLKGEINLRTAEVELHAYILSGKGYTAWRDIVPLGYEIYARFDE